VTVQAQLVKDQVRVVAKAWGVVRAEVEWAGLLPQGRVVIVCAQTVEQKSLMWQDSLAIKEAVLNVVRK